MTRRFTAAAASLVFVIFCGGFVELQWVAPGSDQVALLSRKPADCLDLPADPAEKNAVLAGRLAFRSPVLLGGLAARRGMSCDSCHRGGHGNPDFFIESLSAAPGQADVTSGLFGTGRDDGLFNPVVIPSLVGAGGKGSFGTVLPEATLAAFVEGVILREFDGRKPPTAIFDGLLAYIRALSPAVCSQPDKIEQTLGYNWRDVNQAYTLIGWYARRGDAAAAQFVAQSLRRHFGRIAQRYAGMDPAIAILKQLSARVNHVSVLLGRGNPAVGADLSALGDTLDEAYQYLSRREGESLYDRARLRAYLARDVHKGSAPR